MVTNQILGPYENMYLSCWFSLHLWNSGFCTQNYLNANTLSFRLFLNWSDLYKPNPNHSSSANSWSSLRLASPGHSAFLETKQCLGKASQLQWKEHWIRRWLQSFFHSHTSELSNLISLRTSVFSSTQHKLTIMSFSETLWKTETYQWEYHREEN